MNPDAEYPVHTPPEPDRRQTALTIIAADMTASCNLCGTGSLCIEGTITGDVMMRSCIIEDGGYFNG